MDLEARNPRFNVRMGPLEADKFKHLHPEVGTTRLERPNLITVAMRETWKFGKLFRQIALSALQFLENRDVI